MSMGRAGHNPLLSFPAVQCEWKSAVHAMCSESAQCAVENLHNVQWRDIIEVLKVVVSPVRQLAQSELTLSTILQPGDLTP